MARCEWGRAVRVEEGPNIKKKAGAKISHLPGKPGTRKQLLPLLPFGPDGVGSVSATRLPYHFSKWRRGEDSNLRYPLRYTHFPGVRLKPDSATSPRSGKTSLCQSTWFGKGKIGANRKFKFFKATRWDYAPVLTGSRLKAYFECMMAA